MTSPDLARKVQQLDNDVHEIYGLLHGIAGTQTRHGNRLDELAAAIEAHDARFDGIDRRLDGIDGHLDTMDAKLDRVIQLVGGDQPAG